MRIVVGVLRGGPSSEYEVSLKTGASVLAELNKEKYEPRDIFISRDGMWHLYGTPVQPERALGGVDVVFNALHGDYGEDGKVQRLLDILALPYTGSNAFASALSFNKHDTREEVTKLGVKIAHGIVINKPDNIEQTAFDLFRSFPHPAIVKPVTGGSSVGVSVVYSFEQMQPALENAFRLSHKVLVEEFIKGKEASVGVIDSFRNEKTYALMPIEIAPAQGHSFFSYDAKYGGKSKELCPGNFTDEEKEQLSAIARSVHEGLRLSHYSRSDFIVSKRGIYFLEVNTLPCLTGESLIPKALHAVGAKLSEFLEHVINLAYKSKK